MYHLLLNCKTKRKNKDSIVLHKEGAGEYYMYWVKVIMNQ